MSKQPPLFIDMKDIEARIWLMDLIDREGMGNAEDKITPRWNTDALNGERKNITYEFMGESKDQESEKSNFEKENYTQKSNTSGKYWFRKDDDEEIGKKYHFSEHPMFDKLGCNTCPNSGSRLSDPTDTCLRNSQSRGASQGQQKLTMDWVRGKYVPGSVRRVGREGEGKEGRGGRRKKTKRESGRRDGLSDS